MDLRRRLWAGDTVVVQMVGASCSRPVQVVCASCSKVLSHSHSTGPSHVIADTILYALPRRQAVGESASTFHQEFSLLYICMYMPSNATAGL